VAWAVDVGFENDLLLDFEDLVVVWIFGVGFFENDLLVGFEVVVVLWVDGVGVNHDVLVDIEVTVVVVVVVDVDFGSTVTVSVAPGPISTMEMVVGWTSVNVSDSLCVTYAVEAASVWRTVSVTVTVETSPLPLPLPLSLPSPSPPPELLVGPGASGTTEYLGTLSCVVSKSDRTRRWGRAATRWSEEESRTTADAGPRMVKAQLL
jgi:hypothetical protein